jgi:hypothetical protein
MSSVRTLDNYQNVLLQHFRELSSKRKSGGQRLFALEHPLTSEETEDLTRLVNAELRRGNTFETLWLVWVIYSTEIGYTYNGDEYWTSFQEKTPIWDNAHRGLIRDAFIRFENTFYAVVPEGAWADHFSIISRPITNAILPKDLQISFAKLLYNVRNEFSLNARSARDIGKLLKRNSREFTSSRLDNFLEQPELAGRITLAMLYGNEHEDSELIRPETLLRIVSDLERKKNAKAWVSIARRKARIKLEGLSKVSDGQQKPVPVGPVKPIGDFEFRAYFFLQRVERNAFIVGIDVPTLPQHKVDNDLFEKLMTLRVKIGGVNGTPVPAVNLAAGLKRRLDQWPSTDRSLFEINGETELSDRIFDWRPSDPPWVFMTRPDGYAYEVVGKSVRSGNTYIVAYPQGYEAPTFGDECFLQCQGISARIITLEDVIPADIEDALRNFNIRVTKTVRLSPIGYPAFQWDTDGYSEWFSTDEPCFALLTDGFIPSVKVSLNGHSITVPNLKPGVPSFIQLPCLDVGRHILEVSADKVGSEAFQAFAFLNVREPLTTDAAKNKSPITLTIDPPTASADDLLSNEARIQLFGPSNLDLSLDVNCFDGDQLVGSLATKKIVLPFEEDELSRYLTEEGRKREFLLSASRIEIRIHHGELGAYCLSVKRKLPSLRWSFTEINHQRFMRLVDESDGDFSTFLYFYDINDPSTQIKFNPAEWKQRVPIRIRGLFSVKNGNQIINTVVSYPESGRSLAALAISPIIPRLGRDPLTELSKAYGLGRMWSLAQTFDLLSQAHKESVVIKFECCVFKTLLGEEWISAEEAFMADFLFRKPLYPFESLVGHREFATQLRHRVFSLIDKRVNLGSEIEWFIRSGKRMGLARDYETGRFVMEFCNSPFGIPDRLQDNLKREIPNILRHRELVKGGRFFLLCLRKLMDNPLNRE